MSLEERERVACWSAGLMGEWVSAGEGVSRGDGRCSMRMAPCHNSSLHLLMPYIVMCSGFRVYPQ